jgi:hypothetical protein
VTRDEILYAAQNHWLYDLANPREELAGWLVEFANVIAAHEREACAKVCEAQYRDYEWAIHERDGAESCAAAIRARGQ